MKVFASLVTLALAAGAVAQAIPPCAVSLTRAPQPHDNLHPPPANANAPSQQSCADPFLTNGIGGCGLDPGCICGDKSFIEGISCCVLDKCEAKDQTSAVVFASVVCSATCPVPGEIWVLTLPCPTVLQRQRRHDASYDRRVCDDGRYWAPDHWLGGQDDVDRGARSDRRGCRNYGEQEHQLWAETDGCGARCDRRHCRGCCHALRGWLRWRWGLRGGDEGDHRWKRWG